MPTTSADLSEEFDGNDDDITQSSYNSEFPSKSYSYDAIHQLNAPIPLFFQSDISTMENKKQEVRKIDAS